ncbi:MAG: response regulator [Deferribacteres bacterium]|nr:response regulator [candidate division KSB1 bacterium]MCB9508611.1 response regulator [Deferribacteres bacterium]
MDERILVVSDTKKLRSLYESELGERGFAIEVSDNGEEAMQKLQQELIDLVLLDLDLERGQGLSYLQEFVSICRQAKVVVVADSPEYKRDFHCWAADAYLLKSLDLDELKRTIETILHGE